MQFGDQKRAKLSDIRGQLYGIGTVSEFLFEGNNLSLTVIIVLLW